MNELVFNTLFIITILVVLLYYNKKANTFDRPIWYKNKKLFSIQLDGKDTSQQPFDIYTFTHFSSGILIYLIANYFNYTDYTIFYIGLILGILFEICENTQYIINKYRENKAYKNYHGDSMANIMGDMFALILGICFSRNFKDLSFYYLIIAEIVLSNYNAGMYDLSIGGISKI